MKENDKTFFFVLKLHIYFFMKFDNREAFNLETKQTKT